MEKRKTMNHAEYLEYMAIRNTKRFSDEMDEYEKKKTERSKNGIENRV